MQAHARDKIPVSTLVELLGISMPVFTESKKHEGKKHKAKMGKCRGMERQSKKVKKELFNLYGSMHVG